MKIYFTCSTAEFKKYKEDYFAIRKLLINENHLLTRDWLPKADKRILSVNNELKDIKKIYKECRTAIDDADLVIIEDTVSNFSTGHQITIALQRRKPTLVLWQGKKHKHFKKMFIHGVESDFLEVSEYSPGKFQDIVKTFISKFEDFKEKNRFHLVLDGVERKYLDWAQYRYGKSRTKLIRLAIRTALNSDKEYQDYLSGTANEFET